jgi:peroxiredoxin
MRKSCVVLVLVLGLSAWIAAPANAQPAAPAAPAAAEKAGKVNADELLKQMAEYLGKLPAFSCKVESAIEMSTGDRQNKSLTKMTVRLERPNRLAMIVDEGMMGMTVVSNGKELTQYLPMTKRYIVKEAPPTFEGITDIGAPVAITMLGMSEVVIPSSGEEFYRNLSEGVVKSEYVGEEKVGDVLCHHCRFVQEDFDWDIWIEVGKRPLVHKVQPDLAKQFAASSAPPDLKMSYVVTLTDWNTEPKFTPEDFTFKAPAGAQKSDSLFEVPEEAPHPLLGMAAQPFTTTDVEGKPIDLNTHLGKNVILLDFWATWCGPCVRAMPQVDEVAKKYKEKGLVFYAVNAGEDAETIKKFLAEAKLDPTVALDLKNEIGPLYGVEGIPQTVLIGKDGKVQVVHVGFSPQLGKMLAKEVEELLAGKDLAKEKLAKIEEKKKAEADAQQANPPAEEPKK